MTQPGEDGTELLGKVWDNWYAGWRQRAVRRVAPRLARVLDEIADAVTAEMRAQRAVLHSGGDAPRDAFGEEL